jgi:hypothetical protein
MCSYNGVACSSSTSCKGLVKAEFFLKSDKGPAERVTPTMCPVLLWQNDTEASLYSGYFLCSCNIKKAPVSC